MANQLYGYNPSSYGGATTSSLYSSRSIADSYLPADTSLRGSAFRFLSADSLSAAAAAISSSMLYNPDSYSTKIPGVSVTTSTSSYAPPGVDLGSTITSTDSLYAGLKRASSDSLYHPLGAHNPIGQTEAWYPADLLAKRPRYESTSNLPIYPQRPGEKDCAFYMQTRTCKFGESCKFDHPIWVPEGGIPDWKEVPLVLSESLPERPGEPNCPYFLKTQRCKFGVRCKFNHPKEALQGAPGDIDVSVLPERPSEPPCAFYMKTGNCKFGMTCKFHHPKGVQIQSVGEENGAGVQQKITGDGKSPLFTPASLHNSKGLPIRSDGEDCPFYLKTGSCKYGATCRYSHPERNAAHPLSTKNLPNMDMIHKTFGDMFKFPGNMSNKIEGQANSKITSDPYVSITLTGATIGRTFVIKNDENPVWRQNFILPVAHYASEVSFVVKDNDVVGSQHIGTVSLPVEHIYGGGKLQGQFPILNASGKPCKAGAVLSLSIQYYPIEQLSIYHHGIGAGPNYQGVHGTYFPLRRGGTVTLYQDSHVPDGSLPSLKLDNGMQFINGKCWRDIFEAIRHARRFIYITGWSVWHKVRLVRDDSSISDSTLGELLKSKSQEGVRVLLLVWDDPTSRSILGYKTDGVMQTHDEETRRFFKHSSVQVLLCPRVAGKRHSWVNQREVGVIYTHHQKTVIVDADAGNNRRRIIAFLGGLDLCDGRYDTPQHPIFRTLHTWHSDDYHNPTYTGSTTGCPREPWHDLHCKIDGPAAYDVLTNFEDRWRKASRPHGIKKLKTSSDDALLSIERIPDIVGLSDAPCVSDDDPESWHAQVFRSIDSNSVKGFPKDPKEATMRNLVCGKNVLIDMSIHTAYVKAIRAAQHFIYIENQYFIGSSYNWSSYKDIGANNLIPMEIALKIAEKIRAHQRFAAYIVVPMWPEGNPTGAATQRILFWQHKTMQMMYETIHKALVEVGLEDAYSPQDYLNFYCLGNRETLDACDLSESVTTSNTPQGLSRKNRRFMIYVHSKGMIVDDEYVILGSANINQRSMEGTRDTEIAMGAYQPHHTWARRLSSPRGQIYGYRMSLWAEHLGILEDCFTRPESLECVRRVRSMGEANWNQFASNEVLEMRGHLLKYPVDVDRKGKVKPLPNCETFPDVGGNIVGSFLAIQENLTI